MAKEKKTNQISNKFGASMEKIVSLAKRRGFVYPSSEIYGGLSATWDYGPLGVELKKNIQEIWWREMTRLQENIVGLDAAIMMHPKTRNSPGYFCEFQECG
jgi:glycyl-tRNA synthetase